MLSIGAIARRSGIIGRVDEEGREHSPAAGSGRTVASMHPHSDPHKTDRGREGQQQQQIAAIGTPNTAGPRTAPRQHIAHPAAAPEAGSWPSRSPSRSWVISSCSSVPVSFSRHQRHRRPPAWRSSVSTMPITPAQRNQLLVRPGCRESLTWVRTGALGRQCPAPGESGAGLADVKTVGNAGGCCVGPPSNEHLPTFGGAPTASRLLKFGGITRAAVSSAALHPAGQLPLHCG